MRRYLWLAFLVLVVAWVPGVASATCTDSPQTAFSDCTTSSEAYGRAASDPGFGSQFSQTCGLAAPHTTAWRIISVTGDVGTCREASGKCYVVRLYCDGSSTPSGGPHYVAAYTTLSCSTSQSNYVSAQSTSDMVSSASSRVCYAGCSYYGKYSEEVGGTPGMLYYATGYMKGVGAACSDPVTAGIAQAVAPTGNEVCNDTSVAGLKMSQCLDTVTGKQCVVGARGKYCWNSGEVGTKSAPTQDEAVSRNVPPTVGTAPPGMVNVGTDSSTIHTQTDSTTGSSNVTYNYTLSNPTGVSTTGVTETTTGSSGTGIDADADNAASGGSCSASYACSGDAIKCAILEEQRQARCATQWLANNGSSSAASLSHIKGALDSAFDGTEAATHTGTSGEDAGDVDAVKHSETFSLSSIVDTGGFLPHSVPSAPTFTLGSLGSHTVDAEQWADLFSVLSAIFVFIASLIALRIYVE